MDTNSNKKMKPKRFTKLIAFRASPETKEKLDEVSLKMQLTEGELLREALGDYLKDKVKGLIEEEKAKQDSQK